MRDDDYQQLWTQDRSKPLGSEGSNVSCEPGRDLQGIHPDDLNIGSELRRYRDVRRARQEEICEAELARARRAKFADGASGGPSVTATDFLEKTVAEMGGYNAGTWFGVFGDLESTV